MCKKVLHIDEKSVPKNQCVHYTNVCTPMPAPELNLGEAFLKNLKISSVFL